MTAPTSAQDAARQEVRIKGAVDRLRRHGYPTEADMIEAQQQANAELRRRVAELEQQRDHDEISSLHRNLAK